MLLWNEQYARDLTVSMPIHAILLCENTEADLCKRGVQKYAVARTKNRRLTHGSGLERL